jgi:hypothetical protein
VAISKFKNKIATSDGFALLLAMTWTGGSAMPLLHINLHNCAQTAIGVTFPPPPFAR